MGLKWAIPCLLLSSLVFVETNRISTCFLQSNSFDSLIACLSQFILRTNSISEGSDHLLPTDEILNSLNDAAYQLMSVSGDCHTVLISQPLESYYKVTEFTDITTGISYCFLHEITMTADEGSFLGGWGLMSVPKSLGNVERSLHISCTHPLTDGAVHKQSGAIFHLTNSRSLLIATAARDASLTISKCDKGCSWTGCYVTDGAHDNTTGFHSMAKATLRWQLSHTDSRSPPIFLQFHGKAENTCANDTIFLSPGKPASKQKSIAQILPVQTLQTELIKASGGQWNVKTLTDDYNCKLTAGSNIFGRLINGVPNGQECKGAAASISGMFIHAEQSETARLSSNYGIWVEAIKATLPSTRNSIVTNKIN